MTEMTPEQAESYAQQKAEHEAHEAKELAKGLCPASGERLGPAELDAWGRMTRACWLCDCFGYDPEDVRLK